MNWTLLSIKLFFFSFSKCSFASSFLIKFSNGQNLWAISYVTRMPMEFFGSSVGKPARSLSLSAALADCLREIQCIWEKYKYVVIKRQKQNQRKRMQTLTWFIVRRTWTVTRPDWQVLSSLLLYRSSGCHFGDDDTDGKKDSAAAGGSVCVTMYGGCRVVLIVNNNSHVFNQKTVHLHAEKRIPSVDEVNPYTRVVYSTLDLCYSAEKKSPEKKSRMFSDNLKSNKCELIKYACTFLL